MISRRVAIYKSKGTFVGLERTPRYRGTRLIIALLVGLFCFSFSAPARDKEVTDENISQAVRDVLTQDSAVPEYWINVDTAEGIVRLSGKVNNLLAKQRAQNLAETVKGVRAVLNNIEVTPPLRPESEIQEDIKDALLTDPATESFEIEVSVNGGIAKLTGTVDSWQEKQLAGKVASSVRGVKGLNNLIDVDYQLLRTDAEIEAEIEKTLRWDALVDHALIDVEVTDGNATLTGTVGSAAEKSRAVSDAWVIGVESVDAEGLAVASWARDPRFRKDKYVEKPEKQIETAVKDALRYNATVEASDVKVNVDNGVATLRGQVETLAAKKAAGKSARNTVGVWRVKNQLIVMLPAGAERRLQNKVEQTLKRNVYLDKSEISASVTDNEVYLYGMVDSYFEKAEAEDAVSALSGVAKVYNNIEVQEGGNVFSYTPYLDVWYPFGYHWFRPPDIGRTAGDWEIKEEIEDELYWSPYVDEEEVTVEVDNGVATLTGIVETWDEREAAEQNAYEGGAVDVDNNLVVQYGPEYYGQ